MDQSCSKPRGLLMNRISIVTAISGILISTSLVAQERLPGVVDRPEVPVPTEVTEPKEIPAVKEPAKEQVARPDQAVAVIKRVNFTGDVLIDEKALQAAAAPYLNKKLTRGDVAKLKYDITKLYYAKGYLLTKVTTPPQDLTSGVLEVSIVSGRIGSLEIEGDDLNPRVASAMANAKIKQGDAFHEKTVESALKDIDDLTNIKAKLNLRPGKEVGTTDLKVLLEKADEDVQTFTLDNYGSELTGEVIAGLDLQKSNFFKQGETLGLGLRKSEDELETITLSGTIPLGWRNLKLELDYLNSDNEIGDRLAALLASGETERFGVAISSALYNQIQDQAVLRGGIDVREHKSFLANVPETEDNITQAYVEGTYLKRHTKYVAYVALRLNKGIDAFGADDKGEADNTRVLGDPQAWTFQPLVYANFRVRDNDFIQVYARGQWASETLLSSDLFAIGGYGNVRGFQPAQEAGEDGFIASVEYSHEYKPRGKWGLKGAVFVDYGTVDNDVAGSVVDDDLKSAGLGFEATYNHSSKYKSKIRLDWAHTIGDYTATTIDDDTLYFRFTQNF